MKINILSIEKYLPQNRIASEELDRIAGIYPGKIEKNTGVAFRHHVSGNESVAEMGARALTLALKKARLEPKDLDLLIFAGGSFDYPIPHNSVIIKSKITDDSVDFYCLDIDSTCLSFLNAMDIAHLYIQAGRYKRIAIVCAEIASLALSPADEKVFGLFGDASVAMILEPSETKGYTAQFNYFLNYPSGALYAHVPMGGAINRGIGASAKEAGYYFKMDGKNLIRLTFKHMEDFVTSIEKDVKHKINSFDHIITHQASKYGNSFFKKQFNIPQDKFMDTLSIYGNCISASIPLGLEALMNQSTDLTNKQVLLLGSGAGLSLGALVIRFD